MKLSNLGLFAIAIIFLSSCAATRYASKADIRYIDELALVSPLTNVSYVESNGTAEHNDSLSMECARLISESVKASGLPLDEVIHIDFTEEPFYQDAVAGLSNINPKKAGEYGVPTELVMLLREHGQRYGLFLFANGFVMNNKKYAKDMALGVGLAILTGVLTMGTIASYAVPSKNQLAAWAVVVDSETGKVVYFNSGLPVEVNPVKAEHVKRVIDDLLDDFCRLNAPESGK